jgi:hypothetical protein
MWMSCLLGAGSTGGVYKGSLGKKLYAVKVVEILGRDDVPRRQRLQSECGIYSRLEQAYRSGHLAQRITPRYHGAFGNRYVDALVMDLHGSALSDWTELQPFEW